jgi:hypothetical protein
MNDGTSHCSQGEYQGLIWQWGRGQTRGTTHNKRRGDHHDEWGGAPRRMRMDTPPPHHHITTNPRQTKGTSITHKRGNEWTTGTTYDECNHNERMRRDNRQWTKGHSDDWGEPRQWDNEQGWGGTGNGGMGTLDVRLVWHTPRVHKGLFFHFYLCIFMFIFRPVVHPLPTRWGDNLYYVSLPPRGLIK